jgi:hypothetical protein
MKSLFLLLMLSLFAGTVAAAIYVATVVEPVVWSACAIWLSFSGGTRVILGGVADVVRAKHPSAALPGQTVIEQAVIMGGGTPWEQLDAPRGRR